MKSPRPYVLKIMTGKKIKSRGKGEEDQEKNISTD